MDFKPANWNEVNRITDEKLLQMSKNDAVIRLIQQRQGRGIIHHQEISQRTATANNVWTDTYNMSNLEVGVGRLIQVRVFIPHTFIDAGSTSAYSAMRVWNNALNRQVAFCLRRCVPYNTQITSFGGIDVASGYPDNADDIKQSVFMMGLFPTGDQSSHTLKVQANPYQGNLIMDSGGYITVEDVGGMAAFPQ